jgi:hypothetical protein
MFLEGGGVVNATTPRGRADFGGAIHFGGKEFDREYESAIDVTLGATTGINPFKGGKLPIFSFKWTHCDFTPTSTSALCLRIVPFDMTPQTSRIGLFDIGVGYRVGKDGQVLLLASPLNGDIMAVNVGQENGTLNTYAPGVKIQSDVALGPARLETSLTAGVRLFGSGDVGCNGSPNCKINLKEEGVGAYGMLTSALKIPLGDRYYLRPEAIFEAGAVKANVGGPEGTGASTVFSTGAATGNLYFGGVIDPK